MLLFIYSNYVILICENVGKNGYEKATTPTRVGTKLFSQKDTYSFIAFFAKTACANAPKTNRFVPTLASPTQ